jgi:putative transposase
MNRRRIDFHGLDVATWPGVAYTEFGDEESRAFQRRVNAVERYAGGESIGDIELATGVNRRQLYRLLERGLAQHPDGRIGIGPILASVILLEPGPIERFASRQLRFIRALRG